MRRLQARITDDAFVLACKTCKSLIQLCEAAGVKARSSVHDRIRMLIGRGMLKDSDILYKRVNTSDRPYGITDDKAEVERLQKQMEAWLALKKPVSTHRLPELKTSGNALPIICWSDWHMDETVRLGEVPGCDNQYNVDIARKRAKTCAQGSSYLISHVSRALGRVDEAILWIGGDMFSGHIHEELAETNACSPIKAAVTIVQPALIDGITHILDNAKLRKLIVICNYGNHSRITPRIRHKTGHDHNLEWLMYQSLRQYFSADKRVEFHVSEAYHYYYKAFDFSLRFSHGDNISYGGGVGGIAIPAMKAISQWNKIHRADLDIVGHFHQRRDFGNLICNGSLVGMGAYAVAIKADYERPQQQFAVIQPGKGKTMSAEIFCE